MSKLSRVLFSVYIFIFLDLVHSMPVSQMGNYQEYLKRMTSPLREVESMPVRQHMFGNPFKIDKVSNTYYIIINCYFIKYFSLYY